MNRAIFHDRWSEFCFLVLLSGCGGDVSKVAPPEAPEVETKTSASQTQTPPAPPISIPQTPHEPPEVKFTEGSCEMMWAKGFTGELIKGRDGNLYEPYRASTIEETQTALAGRGIYSGPINGVLDRPTMEAIQAFQELNYNLLQVCGIPTPRTRKMLEQGSHTDPR